MSFDFATAGRIIFGRDTISQIASIGSEFGEKPLVLTGRGRADVERLFKCLETANMNHVSFQVDREPAVEEIEKAANLAKSEKCDYVIGFGGGSVLDSGKAVSAILTNPGSITDYLESVGKNLSVVHPSLPFIAIPTTSGTGSEVTRNAVLTVTEKRIKVSMRSPLMLPRVALIDPTLTFSVPPDVTAFTGMDALTQVIEPYVSKKRNEFTDLTCLEGIRRAAASLRKAYHDGNDYSARENMSFASLMGGISLANAGLGMVHGFAGVIGGMSGAHHGAICATLLPAVVEVNICALRTRDPENSAIVRYIEMGRILNENQAAKDSDIWVCLQHLKKDLQIPSLRDMDVKKEQFGEIISAAQKASSTKGNPILLEEQELHQILEMAY